MSLRKSGFLAPSTMSHFVILWFDPPGSHVTHQKVTSSDSENYLKKSFICVHRVIKYGQNSLKKRENVRACMKSRLYFHEFCAQKI